MERSKEQIMIDEIMDWFDFSKMAKAMASMEWRISHNMGYSIPDEQELRELARHLMMDAIDFSEKEKDVCTYIKTGPFKVTCFRVDDAICKIILEFVVTDWVAQVEKSC